MLPAPAVPATASWLSLVATGSAGVTTGAASYRSTVTVTVNGAETFPAASVAVTRTT